VVSEGSGGGRGGQRGLRSGGLVAPEPLDVGVSFRGDHDSPELSVALEKASERPARILQPSVAAECADTEGIEREVRPSRHDVHFSVSKLEVTSLLRRWGPEGASRGGRHCGTSGARWR